MRCAWFVIALVAGRAFAGPVRLPGFSDDGVFVLHLNEEAAGRITFQWKADGSFVNRSVLTIIGGTFTNGLAITADRNGRLAQAIFDDRRGQTRIVETGGGISISAPDKQESAIVPDDLVLYEDTSPALISLALSRYDVARGGTQNFARLNLSGGDIGSVAIERRGSTRRFAGAGTLKLTEWILSFTGTELDVLAGEDNRVYLVTGLPWFASAGFSEQHAFYAREGYENLNPSTDADPLVSPPKYDVRVESISIPMRDGVKLSADVYFPAGVDRAPVILSRTPYGKASGDLDAHFWARRGYIRVIQDVRGRFASGGEWEPLMHETQDGYDTIEWLGAQRWSTGKVGMIGESYAGAVQWLAAIGHPPHLATIVPNVSPTDPFYNFPYENGVVDLMSTLQWLAIVESNFLNGNEALEGKNFDSAARMLPVIEMDKALLGRESPIWRQWMAHPSEDSYWRRCTFLDRLKDVHIPVFHQSGWFDGDGVGTKRNYLGMAQGPGKVQKMTIGPWKHTSTATRSSGNRDFGPTAVIDLQRDYLRWFDYWLKGVENHILAEPLISLYVMGSNRWLHGNTYPLRGTRFEKLFLKAGGRLSFDPPEGKQLPDRYIYNPADPTPDPGYDDSPTRQEVTAQRKDILVYVSEPYEKPYTIAGPMRAVLYASTSARDTDWYVHVLDVDPAGNCVPLWANNSAGVMRARYRESIREPKDVEPGRIYAYDIDLWHTGMTLLQGHRLRVEVSSADLPIFSRNLNTGANSQLQTRSIPARQAVYHDAQHQSYIVLPVVPEQ